MNPNNNDVMESSSSSTLNALTGLNVVIEDESDYVFVGEDIANDTDGHGLLLDAEEWDFEDDESYDHCDLSPSLSCATSVATNVTLKDLNLIEDSAMMMDVDEEESERPAAMETDDGVGSNTMTNQGIDSSANAATTVSNENFPATSINPKGGTRRLSNKKLRKRMKLLKKASAARAAAEALAAANRTATGVAAMSGSSSSESTVPPDAVAASSAPAAGGVGAGSPRRQKPANLAVACAQESLAAYRTEIEARKARAKKTRAVSIDVQQ